MLHFQVFTSASPPSLPSAVRPPLSDPSILRALLTPPSRSRLSPSPCAPCSFSLPAFALSFPLSVSPYPLSPTLYLSLPFFRCDNASLTIAPSSSTGTQTLSQTRIYEYTMKCSPHRLYRDPPPVEEDLFVLRGSLPRHNGRLTDVHPLCLPFPDVDRVREGTE